MYRGKYKCSMITDPVGSALSTITEIVNESARYAENSMFG